MKIIQNCVVRLLSITRSPVTLGATILAFGLLATATPAQAISESFSCPASGVICYYDSTNFHNLLGYTPVSSCSGTYVLNPIRNRTESVRNRTGCRVYLLYYCGSSRCYREWMRPHSDDDRIEPLNQIDEVRLTAG